MPTHKTTVLLLSLYCFFNSYFFGDGRVLVKKLQNCSAKIHYSLKVNSTLKVKGREQYMNTTLILTSPLDNNIRSNSSVEMLIGNQFVYLFTINEKKSCDAMNKYFGELWYDFERHAQIIPGLCPISQGRYRLHNYLLDFNKMATLNNFPFGHMRLTDFLYYSNNTIYSCILFEVDNRM